MLSQNERDILYFIEYKSIYTVDFRDINDYMGMASPRLKGLLKKLEGKNLINRDYMDWYQVTSRGRKLL